MFDLGIAAIAPSHVWLRIEFHDGTHAHFTHGLVDTDGWFRVVRPEI